MSDEGRLYEFAFRGLLTEEALDAAGRAHKNVAGAPESELAGLVALDSLDERFVAAAQRMSVVYTGIAAFESSARKLIGSVLVEQFKAEWWEKGVSAQIRKKAESRKADEDRIKWHGQRGGSRLDYTELADLASIIRNNWTLFEPHVRSVEWATSIFSVIERSRNVIMHSGELGLEDVARIGINIRDWVKQVGA